MLWVDWVVLMSLSWETREQYAFGWFVPLFALYLGRERWRDRPRPEVLPRSWGLTVFALVVLVLLVPLRVVFEVNRDWPAAMWSYTPLLISLTLGALFATGGWPWVRHFAFPVAFVLVALVLPYRLEKGLTQSLMQVVAAVTVEGLGLLGIPAMQQGNVIEIGRGMVGIDEACSGVRSMQSTYMSALLMGDLYRLTFGLRLTLLGAGFVAAFAMNVGRTLLLTYQAHQSGLESVEKWHDPAGYSIAVATLLVLWGIAAWLASRAQRGKKSAAATASGASVFATLVPTRYLVGVGCWGIATLLITELWYRSHDRVTNDAYCWSVRYPTQSSEYQEIQLAPRARRLLGHDEGAAASWKSPTGVRWDAYFFRWQPKSITHVIQARMHRPERCLPAFGVKLVEDAGVEHFAVGALKIPFRKYTYDMSGKRLHVFFCLWEDGVENQTGVWSMQGERLRAALAGRGVLGQQTFEIILTGHESLEAATKDFRLQLGELVRPAS